MECLKDGVQPLKDLTTSNITPNTILTNSHGPNPRLTFVLERLVTHLHDFARETCLNTREWTVGIDFLTEVGKKCTDTRQEFILLSDILGLSLLVDSIAHPRPPPATEGSVLGPFHTHDHPPLSAGDFLSHDPQGEPCLVLCSISDTQGTPISDVEIDIWETDSSGHYDVQYESGRTDGRGVMHSDKDGKFWFKGIVPVSYQVPNDGPVGKLLALLRRHPWRPAHIHIWMRKEGWDGLVTALYISSDPHITSDAVFGVKSSLCVTPRPACSSEQQTYNVHEGTQVIQYGFVLMGEEDARYLRDEKNREAMARLGKGKWKLDGEEGLPIVDLD
ncbi:MAG: hypothetical protein Q9184_005100 [Pyrenodesmia sp. 2 TL-2023]